MLNLVVLLPPRANEKLCADLRGKWSPRKPRKHTPTVCTTGSAVETHSLTAAGFVVRTVGTVCLPRRLRGPHNLTAQKVRGLQ